MKKSALLLFLSLSFVFGCKKKDTTTSTSAANPVPDCQVASNDNPFSSYQFVYNSNNLIDSFSDYYYWTKLIYNTNGQIINRIDRDSGGNIIKNNYSFVYDGNGALSQYRSSSLINSYFYNSKSQLIKEFSKIKNSATDTNTIFYLLRYDSKGNLSSIVTSDSTTNILIDSTVYEYDEYRNPFTNFNKVLIILNDLDLSDYSRFSGLSTNNIVTAKAYNRGGGITNIITYDYEYNSMKFPIKAIITLPNSNQTFNQSFTYNCH